LTCLERLLEVGQSNGGKRHFKLSKGCKKRAIQKKDYPQNTRTQEFEVTKRIDTLLG
jgi:hypothetical protein